MAGKTKASPRSSSSRVSSSALARYGRDSRDPLNTVVAVLPLFLLYQVGILMSGGVRNGADFVTDVLMLALGGSLKNYLLFNGVVLVGFVIAIVVLRNKGQLHPRLFPLMFVESALYALLFGATVTTLIRTVGLGGLLAAGALDHPSLVQKLVLSTGAGLYEELVFRVLLMGGIIAVLKRNSDLHPFVSGLIGLVVSSFIFSGVHHIGSLGEPFTISAFTFRFFAGVVLAGLFQARGFAIAAWTHALYDVIVMVFKNG